MSPLRSERATHLLRYYFDGMGMAGHFPEFENVTYACGFNADAGALFSVWRDRNSAGKKKEILRHVQPAIKR